MPTKTLFTTLIALPFAALLPLGGSAAAAEPILLHAAGSLRVALTEVVGEHSSAHGIEVKTAFGPAGALRERIEQGEPAEIFASGNLDHPERLAAAGKAATPVLFARNRVCALTDDDIETTPHTLLDTLLSESVRLGVSTPGRDPLGDYTLELFYKADALRPGAGERLKAKAKRLAGGLDSPKPPEGRNAYGWVIETELADLFLTYCTNAILAQGEVPGLRVVQLPESLAVGADYGLTVVHGASEAASELAFHILSPRGQAVLARHRFQAVGLPQK
jgi:molybdate transport system substrate-binding protein